MRSPRRVQWIYALLICGGLFFSASHLYALPENEIRDWVRRAEGFERQANWEKAREIYELLLSQKDHGLKIRDRYHHVMRRCWQVRRHQDPSYRKEVLSVDYGQALQLHKIISNSLLDGSIEKKKLDAGKLFRKGLEELDAALSDPFFLEQHVPAARLGDVAGFRALLKKTWSNVGALSRKEAAKQIGEVAMAAEIHLNLSATVVAMEFACGACYAIDEYTVYLTPNQLRELAQSLSHSEAIGVGLTLTIRDNRIVVHSIAMGSPADQLDPPINSNDEIISVNKKAVVDLPLHTVTKLLDGPLGSMVEIEIKTPGDADVRMVRLQRSRAMMDNVNASMLANGIGYVKISSFTDTTVQDVDNALGILAQSGMKTLIVDLRDNNGGIFESAIDTASRFLSNSIITSVLYQNPKENVVHHAKNPNALNVPIVVLVDGDTASAAEVLAGALKDNERATLIGQTTFGKGCTQCVLKLPNAIGGVPTGGMKLTIARFFSPKGVAYSGRGVTPHIFIDERLAQSQSGMLEDAYLKRAIEELNRVTTMQK